VHQPRSLIRFQSAGIAGQNCSRSLAVAGIVYLRPFTVRGNDLALIVILTAAGIVFSGLSGLADSIWRDGRRLMFRAGAVSVITWVAGMGFRFWFAFYAYHGGAASVARFSARHDITDAGIWTDALVLMAFGQVLARLVVLQGRRVRAVSQPAASQHVSADPPEPGACWRARQLRRDTQCLILPRAVSCKAHSPR